MATMPVKEAMGEEVAKRALWLAWKACGGPLGMGFLQDRPDATEEDVWANARGGRDYGGHEAKQSKSGEVHGDYVFGRMMKISLHFTDDTITTDERKLTPEYQAWCREYPRYADLIKAAVAELGAEL